MDKQGFELQGEIMKEFLIKHKDKISTFAGLLGSVMIGILFVAQQFGANLPVALSSGLAVVGGSCFGLLGYLTGKYPTLPKQ